MSRCEYKTWLFRGTDWWSLWRPFEKDKKAEWLLIFWWSSEGLECHVLGS